jgi:hypothetical protein
LGKSQERTIKKFPLLSKDFVLLEDKPYSKSDAESSIVSYSPSSSPSPLHQGELEKDLKDNSENLTNETIMPGYKNIRLSTFRISYPLKKFILLI